MPVHTRGCRVEENLGVREALVECTRGAAESLGIDAGILATGRLTRASSRMADSLTSPSSMPPPNACDWRTRRPRVTMTLMDGEITMGGERTSSLSTTAQR